MKIEEFTLERMQSVWENHVEINLTESGIHPYTLREALRPEEIEELLGLRMTYGWTNGEPSLRETICRCYPGAQLENVQITNGSAESNFLSMWTLLEPGDEMVIVLPNYMQIWGIARSLGVEVKPVHLDERRDWALDVDAVRELAGPRTRIIALCSPNNPTGAVVSPTEMEALAALTEEHGAYLYVDEVYRGAELDGVEGVSAYGVGKRTIVAGGLSKAFALPGLRIGWMVGPKDFIEAAWSRSDYTTITTARASEFVAERVLQPERREEIRQRNRGILNRNLEVLRRWIGERPYLHLVPPRAGGMAFVRYDIPINSTALAERLRDEQSLLVLPGDVYGMDGYFRLGIGSDPDEFNAGLVKLAAGLNGLLEAVDAVRPDGAVTAPSG